MYKDTGDDLLQLQEYKHFNIKVLNTYSRDSEFDEKNLIYEENRNTPIIIQPGSWEVAIERFNISSKNVPLTVFPVAPNRPPFNNTNYLDSPFLISLTYLMHTSTESVKFIRCNFDTPIPTPPAVGNEWPETDIWNIYSVQAILDMINTTFRTAFDGLAATPLGSVPPYLYFNPVSELLELRVDPLFYVNTPFQGTAGPAHPIEIWTNHLLYTQWLDAFYIDYLPNNEGTGREIKFNIQATPPDLVAANDLRLRQCYSTLLNISAFTSILIRADTMPVDHEGRGILDLAIQQYATGVELDAPILTDFQINLLSLKDVRSSSYQYSPSKLRWITLHSSKNIQQMKLAILLKFKDGRERHLKLVTGNISDVKIVFRRKKNIY